jgi:restriction endonuclease S subunit
VFAVKRGEVGKRADVNYNHPKYTALIENLTTLFGERLKTVGNVSDVICGPFGTAIRQDDYTDDGVPLLRITNITKHGFLDCTDMKYITPDCASGLARMQISAGDIVISQRGTLGQCAVVDDAYPVFNISANLIAVKNIHGADAEFVRNYLLSPIGTALLQRTQSGQVQGKITTQDIAEMPIPIVSDTTILNRIIAMAYKTFAAKLREANALLAGMDEYVCAALGITMPAFTPRLGAAVTMRQLKADKAFNVAYYHAERATIMDTIKTIPHRKLGDCADFIHNVVSATDDWYLGLAGVQSDTGELSGADNEATGQAFSFCKDDVLYCRLRPYLNKVWKAERGGVCSTEFHVIRMKSNDVSPDYLAAVMRSQLILRQTRHMMTGNTHPRIGNENVANLLIPVPKKDIQRKITAEIQARQSSARALRAEAETEWTAAKARFEEELLSTKKISSKKKKGENTHGNKTIKAL